MLRIEPQGGLLDIYYGSSPYFFVDTASDVLDFISLDMLENR